MAITNFIPEIWNSRLELDFREQAVAAALANTQYSGDLRSGSSVKITTAVPVTISDYKDNDRTTSAEAVSTVQQELTIDQERAFDFYIDDIDEVQAAGSLEAFTRSASAGMVEAADKFLLNLLYDADAAPVTTDPTADDEGNFAFNVVRNIRKELNKLHVPQGDRVLIVNAEFEALLLGADSKLTSADVSGDSAGLRNATLGTLLGFRVVTSENLPVTATPVAVGFYRPALAYVSQIQKTEAMRGESRFSDRLRGLHVYGGKVIGQTNSAGTAMDVYPVKVYDASTTDPAG